MIGGENKNLHLQENRDTCRRIGTDVKESWDMFKTYHPSYCIKVCVHLGMNVSLEGISSGKNIFEMKKKLLQREIDVYFSSLNNAIHFWLNTRMAVFRQYMTLGNADCLSTN